MSQIATSIEQSKRLLDAGLSRETADMFWRASAFELNENGEWWPQKEGAKIYLNVGKPVNDMDIPAWSLSRLLELGCVSSITVEALVEYLFKTLTGAIPMEEYMLLHKPKSSE